MAHFCVQGPDGRCPICYPKETSAELFGASRIELDRVNAVIDWARQRLETLLAVWDRPNWSDEAKRQVVSDIARSLDPETNPKLRREVTA